MKMLVNFSIALLLGAAALSTPSMAQQKPSNEAYYEEQPRLEAAVFPAADPLKLWMVVEKDDPRASVKVELVNAKNQVIHKQVVGSWQQKFRQRFDLSDMPDGRYTFRISDGHSVREHVFKLSSPGLQEQLPRRLVTLN